MEEKRIIYPRSDGGVDIVIPVPTSGMTIEQLIEQVVPPNTPYKIVDVSDIPQDRTFRNAWEYTP
jgi:hypothetical protein